MNYLKNTALLAAFTAILATAAFAEAPQGKGKGGKGAKPAKPDSAVMITHLSADYAKIAPYDLNVNGTLEESEQELLADAITAGTVTFTPPPGRGAPDGVTPPAEHMVARLSDVYSAVAAYDANVDGTLSSDEQAALKTAIESGELSLGKGPGGPGGPGCPGGRKGGPRGADEDSAS